MASSTAPGRSHDPDTYGNIAAGGATDFVFNRGILLLQVSNLGGSALKVRFGTAAATATMFNAVIDAGTTDWIPVQDHNFSIYCDADVTYGTDFFIQGWE